MTDTTCNGWRNAATWTVNLWFGDTWAAMAEDGQETYITPEYCRETVEAYVEDILARAGVEYADAATGFIFDMLDLNSVDWDALSDHHWPVVDWTA